MDSRSKFIVTKIYKYEFYPIYFSYNEMIDIKIHDKLNPRSLSPKNLTFFTFNIELFCS